MTARSLHEIGRPGTASPSEGLTLPLGQPILPNVSNVDVPLVRLQLRYPDESVFVQRFATNVTRGGIFLASRNPFPVGAVIGFEVSLLQGSPLLAGTGKVAWVREFNPQEPQRAHGMGVQFLALAPTCRPMLDRLLAHKAPPTLRTPSAGVPITTPRPSGEFSAVPTRGGAPSDPQAPLSLDGDPSTWIDDLGVRQAANRARVLASRIEDVEALRARDRDEPPTIEEAIAELPRLLGPRRHAG
jgi:molecular chaperone DnaK